MALTLTPFGQN